LLLCRKKLQQLKSTVVTTFFVQPHLLQQHNVTEYKQQLQKQQVEKFKVLSLSFFFFFYFFEINSTFILKRCEAYCLVILAIYIRVFMSLDGGQVLA